MCIESKTDYKARTGGESPDEADASVCALEYVRVRLNKLPLSDKMIGDTSVSWDKQARDSDIDSNPDNYLCSEL
jgi:hypothetical protein